MSSIARSALRTLPLLLALSACTVGPNYMRPTVPAPATFKEVEGWTPASPQQAAAYETWWAIYNDPVLDDLERQVDVSNQNLKAADAAYRAARAEVQVQRSALFPAITATAAGRQAGSGSRASGNGTINAGNGSSGALYQASLGATWDIDVWGRIRRTIESTAATAKASDADIAAARLSAQSELAIDYFQMRAADEQAQLLTAAVSDFEQALDIAQNRYQVGIATMADVLAAQTQVDGAEAQLVNTRLTRDLMEHAIATLIGKSASDLSLETKPLASTVPVVPVGVPSTLLERRPDIAASEFQVTSANAEIGVAMSAWFPDLTLTGSVGFAATSLGSLFSAPNLLWAVGPTLAETVFNGGARVAQTEEARARYDQAVATYRQTALTAFQQVEDQLSTLKILQEQAEVEDRTVTDARQSEMLALNQYRAGTADFTSVITAQTTRLNAENSALSILSQRLAASTNLVVALAAAGTTRASPTPLARANSSLQVARVLMVPRA